MKIAAFRRKNQNKGKIEIAAARHSRQSSRDCRTAVNGHKDRAVAAAVQRPCTSRILP